MQESANSDYAVLYYRQQKTCNQGVNIVYIVSMYNLTNHAYHSQLLVDIFSSYNLDYHGEEKYREVS